MTIRQARSDAPPEFVACLADLARVRVRPEVTLEESPAPQRIAPYSTAVSVEVRASPEDDVEAASGRFIVLHDPAEPEAWEGAWRLVTYASADLDPEMGVDPMLAEVGWSWLRDTLEAAGLSFHALGGTVTRVLSESFGTLQEKGPSVDIEVRASWSVDGGEVAAHLAAWTDVLCTLGGLPPLPEGVVALPGVRR